MKEIDFLILRKLYFYQIIIIFIQINELHNYKEKYSREKILIYL